MDTYFIM